MALNPDLFKSLYGKLKTDGGFSASPKTGKSPKVGYMVAVPGTEQQIRSQNIAPAHIAEFVQRHQKELAGDNRYIGGWDNNGEVSLDVSQNVRPSAAVTREYGRDVAMADARTTTLDLSIARNQEAAYDLQKGEDLPNPDFKAEGRRGNV